MFIGHSTSRRQNEVSTRSTLYALGDNDNDFSFLAVAEEEHFDSD